jgi:3-phosphoshikimate 1-carboxyvinyltransferase
MTPSRVAYNMAKRWVSKWNASVDTAPVNDIEYLSINGSAKGGDLLWDLPPSKSHLIRLLALSAQSNQIITLKNVNNAGEDSRSMRRCLQQLGVKIEDMANGQVLSKSGLAEVAFHPDSVDWRVHGVGSDGFSKPASVLHAGNSGTAFRILTAISANIGQSVAIDGDRSLRLRDFSTLIGTLESSGVTVSRGHGEEALPLIVCGPVDCEQPVDLDLSKSSQPYSAWMLSSPKFSASKKLNLKGQAVSRKHSDLTFRLCVESGADFSDETLRPWVPHFADTDVLVPRDASMVSFAMLATKVLQTKTIITGWPQPEDALGNDILQQYCSELGFKWSETNSNVEITLNNNSGNTGDLSDISGSDINLRDANDLLPPLAALMAISSGGRIIGAAHAAHKESNRLTKTHQLLVQFGIESTVLQDGIEVAGGQQISSPSSIVPTFGDHRLQMTAVILACACSAKVAGPNLHKIADENLLLRLIEYGINIEEKLFKSK